jgi:hypothetical protein
MRRRRERGEREWGRILRFGREDWVGDGNELLRWAGLWCLWWVAVVTKNDLHGLYV